MISAQYGQLNDKKQRQQTPSYSLFAQRLLHAQNNKCQTLTKAVICYVVYPTGGTKYSQF